MQDTQNHTLSWTMGTKNNILLPLMTKDSRRDWYLHGVNLPVWDLQNRCHRYKTFWQSQDSWQLEKKVVLIKLHLKCSRAWKELQTTLRVVENLGARVFSTTLWSLISVPLGIRVPHPKIFNYSNSTAGIKSTAIQILIAGTICGTLVR